jgi:tRNA pseudouridine55 synthase
MKAAGVHGILIIDKPGGITSRDVVDRVGTWLPPGTRLGHAGTLDPLATGVLVVCAGVATRLIEYIQDMDKTYEAELLLGARSDTDDADGHVEAVAVSQPPDLQTVSASLLGFIGPIEQAPPRYSAARVSGRRAYDLARAGRDFSLEPRRVVIHQIQLLSYRYPALALEIRCSKGTYIRSLARDLGGRLGCGALVRTLRRTATGELGLAEAVSLDTPGAGDRFRLLPVAAAVRQLPQVILHMEVLKRLCQGQKLPVAQVGLTPDHQGDLAVMDDEGELIAIAAVENGRLCPRKVLA